MTPNPLPPSAAPTFPAGTRAATIALGMVVLLQLAAFAWYSPGNDWARDLFMAARIADGGAWPARGPVIGGLFHTGPLWYFVVALPVALGAGFAATTLFVGALATAKIPLAARLGWRLGGARLALPFAALVAVPGWGVYESLQLTHTALLQMLAIAAMLPMLTLWRGGPAWHWLAFGALAGLAVQAHPVAGVLAVPALAVAWRRRARLVGDGPALVAGVAIAWLPTLPMLLAEAREGWPALATIAAAPAPSARAFATEAFALVAASTVGAIAAMRDWAPGAWGIVVVALGVTLALAWLASLPAVARDHTARGRLALVTALWVIGGAWLLAVHVRVPFYMAAVTAPALAFAFAQGLAVAPPWFRGTGVAAALALATIAPLSVIATMRAPRSRATATRSGVMETFSPRLASRSSGLRITSRYEVRGRGSNSTVSGGSNSLLLSSSCSCTAASARTANRVNTSTPALGSRTSPSSS